MKGVIERGREGRTHVSRKKAWEYARTLCEAQIVLNIGFVGEKIRRNKNEHNKLGRGRDFHFYLVEVV